MKPCKIIISGGGTGGHIYPALAIAEELQQHHWVGELLFVGALGRMEMELIPKAGFPIRGLWIDGIQRKLSLRNLAFPFKLVWSLLQATWLLLRFQPKVVVGTGGFASGPLVFIASLFNIPTLIQEQNSYPGITNKLLGKRAKKVAVAYDNMDRFFPKETIVRTGNPIRNTINSNVISSAMAKAFFNLNTEQKTLVVLGGSLGAQTINALIAIHCTYFQQQNIQLLWQCGRQYYEQYKSLEHPQCKILPYVEAMDQLYAAADLIISRAGAGTLAELCIAAKPCILIPSPNVAENHQWHNAQALEQQNAALCLEEKNAEAQFKSVFEGLWNNTEQQRLMQQQLQQLARPQAAKAVVAEIKSIAGV